MYEYLVFHILAPVRLIDHDEQVYMIVIGLNLCWIFRNSYHVNWELECQNVYSKW